MGYESPFPERGVSSRTERILMSDLGRSGEPFDLPLPDCPTVPTSSALLDPKTFHVPSRFLVKPHARRAQAKTARRRWAKCSQR